MQASEPTSDIVAAAVHAATGRRPISIESVRGGFSHCTFRAGLPGRATAVAVRFPVRDVSASQREQRVMALAGAAVPVPEVVYADLDGTRIGRPVLVCRWVDGIALDDALACADSDGAAQLGRAVGQLVAGLSRVALPGPGWFTDDATVEPRERSLAAGIVAHVHSRLFDTDGGRCLPAEVRARFWSIVSESVAELDELEECASLVHGDLAGRNVLMAYRGGEWTIAAVLDWEFALSGPSLVDIGRVVRHRRSQPPEFDRALPNGLRDRGVVLPAGWRRLAWLLDTVALTGPLARPARHPDRDIVSALIAEAAMWRHPWDPP